MKTEKAEAMAFAIMLAAKVIRSYTESGGESPADLFSAFLGFFAMSGVPVDRKVIQTFSQASGGPPFSDADADTMAEALVGIRESVRDFADATINAPKPKGGLLN